MMSNLADWWPGSPGNRQFERQSEAVGGVEVTAMQVRQRISLTQALRFVPNRSS
jgi:hypothetical protein